MGRHAGARDTGSTTGVATAILALISAGTVASITLVGVHQLTPTISERLWTGAPSVRAPAGVVVTPRVVATPSPRASQGLPSNPASTRTSDPAVGSAQAATQRGVTVVVIRALDTVVTTPIPAVPQPTATPTSPALAARSPSALPRTASLGHRSTSRSRESRCSQAQRSASADTRSRSARSRRGSSGCAGHDGRHHRAYPDKAYGDARGHRARGHHGAGRDRGAPGHGVGLRSGPRS